MNPVYIAGTGVWTPSEVITNEELVESFNAYAELFNQRHAAEITAGTIEALSGSSAEFIEKASGIKQRFVMEKAGILDPERMFPIFPERSDDELSLMAEIAVDACRKALAAAGRTGADVDAIFCAASNMQRAYPAMAVEIQQALGAGGYGFDMNVACSSATFAIEQAANALRSGQAKRALVLGPEITSAHLEWRDRDCHFIFGDVSTAVLLESEKSGWEILGSKAATVFSSNIRNNAGFLNRGEPQGQAGRDKLFRQEGRKVFKEVCPMAADHIAGHLAGLGFSPQQVRRYWLHQANLGMNQLIAKKLLEREATLDDAPVILDRYANTASAGSIIAFHEYKDDLAAGDVGVICSFGAGYSIGSHVVRKV